MTDIILKWNNEQFSLFHSDDFVVQNIENLTWAQNELSLTTNPYLAGDTVQNNVGGARDISVTLKPTKDKGDYNDLIHKLARIQGKEVSLVWKNRVIPSYFYDGFESPTHTEETLIEPLVADLIISGVVNEFESQRFDDGVIITFNVHCSNPYWTTVEEEYAVALFDGFAGQFNNYSEMPTGLKFTLTDFTFTNTTDYYEIDICYGSWWDGHEEGDTKYEYTVRFYPLSGYSDAQGEVTFWATFEKGKISLKRGTDESSAEEMSAKVGWKMLRSKKTGPTTFTAYEVTEFPQMPLSAAQEQIAIYARRHGAATLGNVKVSQYPAFI